MQQNFIWWTRWFVTNLLRLMIRSGKYLLRLMTEYPNRIYFESIGQGALIAILSIFFSYMFVIVIAEIRF